MTSDELMRITALVDQYAIKVLPTPRYLHSFRVATLARELAIRFGIDEQEAFLAGLVHDICKAEGSDRLFSLVRSDGYGIGDIEAKKPSLLHGRAAAVLLERDFSVDSVSILDAVRHHTFGSPSFDSLGKIVYVADKLEPGRQDIDPLHRTTALEKDLDGMTRMVAQEGVRYLEHRGREISPETMEMLTVLGERGETA
ncbi:MAG: bis(5'-nucleosyl)-tetraphosphatase (symmetrical) YqeK [Spirochaetales bacterium]|nr:bis(5'-nucleosyl)-tetraphosphatase (symmetrical) YqeK [Spirochaetales bacterium]